MVQAGKGFRKGRGWLWGALLVVVVLVAALAVWQVRHRTEPHGTPPGGQTDAKPFSLESLDVTPLKNPPAAPVGLATRAEKGFLAPDFTVTDIASGKTVKLSDLRGKPVYINFWATWCPWCKIEMPGIQRAYRTRKDEIYFLVVDADRTETQDQIKQFARDNGLTMPLMLDATGKMANDYSVRALPTSVFINKEGVITTIYPGALSERQLTQFLDEASK